MGSSQSWSKKGADRSSKTKETKELQDNAGNNCTVHAGEENHARSGWTTSRRGQDHGVKSDRTPRGRVNQYDRGQRLMEKVRPFVPKLCIEDG